jgi:hypothetical protein
MKQLKTSLYDIMNSKDGLKKLSVILAPSSSVNVQEFSNQATIDENVAYLMRVIQTGISAVDSGWQKAYDISPASENQGKDSFSYIDLHTGLTFTNKTEGVDTNVYDIASTTSTLKFQTIAGGLEITRELLMNSRVWGLERLATEMNAKYARYKSQIAYNLFQAIENSATYNVVYDTTGGNVINKDANTIETAAQELYDAGYSIDAGTELVMICPRAMQNRVDLALGKRSIVVASDDGTRVNANITPVYTSYITYKTEGGLGATEWVGKAANAKLPLGYLTIPGKLNVWAERSDLEILQSVNVKAGLTGFYGFGMYTGAVNAAQVRRVLSA